MCPKPVISAFNLELTDQEKQKAWKQGGNDDKPQIYQWICIGTDKLTCGIFPLKTQAPFLQN